MIKKVARAKKRAKKHKKIRNKIQGTADKPRLTVFKSNKNVSAQIINDIDGHTLASASTVQKELSDKLESTSSIEAAKLVGEYVAKRAVEKGIEEIVFDRSGYIYHGKVKALADAARENGLKF